MVLGLHFQSWYWKKDGDIAVLNEEFGQLVFRYNEESIRLALENVRKFKQDYKTEEAWQKQVDKFSEGVALFNKGRAVNEVNQTICRNRK